MTQIQPRQPKGLPVGGQFMENAHDEQGASLDGGGSPSIPGYTRASDQPISIPGYQRASDSRYRAEDGRLKRRARQWWDAHLDSAPDPRDGIPQMRDDWAVAETGGNSVVGHRRLVDRALYYGEDIGVEMPEASRVKDYAGSVDGTFDVPITLHTDAGDQIDGWVRVTPDGKGHWDARATGFEGKDLIAAEAVRAALESRQPRLSLQGVKDFVAERRQRAREQGARLMPIRNSSFITAARYYPEEKKMVVEIGGKRSYGYEGVDPGTWADFLSNPSSTYNRRIKGSSEIRRGKSISRCPECGNSYSPRNGHVCPIRQRRPELSRADRRYQRNAQKRREELRTGTAAPGSRPTTR